MKVLILAHKPPPFHGQSLMVQRAVEVLGGDRRGRRGRSVQPEPDALAEEPRIECYHVDARLSDDLQQVGVPSVKKLFRLLGYCLQAIWCRFRYGVRILYFVPAHAARPSIARDWMALAICRPFFKTLIFHWHTAGLGEWLRTTARPWERWLTLVIMGRPDLSLVLRHYCRRDAEAFESKHIEIIPNGIPDPCRQFDLEIGPRRHLRAAVRKDLLAGRTPGEDARARAGGDPEVFRVLFLSLCCREKGLFDVLEAVAEAGRQLDGAAVRIELVVAGEFSREHEKAEFEARLRQPDLSRSGPAVRWLGFVSGEEKARLFSTSDCLCFPTYYQAENCPLVLIEAMAFGLPVITTRWRGLDEMLPPGFAGLVDLRSPGQIAAKLLRVIREDYNDSLRRSFEAGYTNDVFARNLNVALLRLA
jgi:glycosyltransferase involved in cell wall biosynthesis